MKQLVFFFLLASGVAFADNIRNGTLQARSDGNNVIVQWGTNDESNIKEFVVERRSDAASDFMTLAVINKKGSNSFYEYIDKSAFKTSGTIYHYRIKVVLNSGSAEYSTVLIVSHNVSSVKRTWGSLKAMFR